MDVQRVRRGHAPNCSASGAVVGMALLSAAATALVVNTFADYFSRWRASPPGDLPQAGSPPARVRIERQRDGISSAWLALPGTAALLLVDGPAEAWTSRTDVRRIDTSAEPIAGAWSAPLEVHVAMGSRCALRCGDCYLDAGPQGSDAELGPLLDDIARLAEMGVFEVAIGGGETGFDERLFAVARKIAECGMVPNLTTSGVGLDAARATEAAEIFGQINVSLDGTGAHYRAVRGWDGSAVGLRAIELLAAAGARVGVNTVLTRGSVGGLEDLARALASRGVVEWQWLRLKPAGRAASDYLTKRLSAEEALSLWPRALQIESETGLVLRWDCAMVPFLVAHGLSPANLERLCVEGCSGGQSLLARTPQGSWIPCSFDHQDAEGGSPAHVWAQGAALTSWRQRAQGPPEPCASCEARHVCRGGCRIVARHLTGDPLAADPECPKVLG